MKKFTVLVVFCDDCRSPNFIPPIAEMGMDFIKAIRCQYCGCVHFDLVAIKNYSKRTRVNK